MEARRCIVCGTKHWSTQPCPAFAAVAAEERRQQIARHAVTKNTPTVTKNAADNTVTKNPTPFSVTLASSKPHGRPPVANPLSDAERARRYRANKRAANAAQNPQGSLTATSS
jgi:hypothetical protein